MRKPTTAHRIVANSLPEIINGLEDLATELRREGVKGPFRAFVDGTLLNCVACWLLGQPKARRKEIAIAGGDLFNAAIASDDPVDFEALLGAVSDPKYTGLPARRITRKKPGSSNNATG